VINMTKKVFKKGVITFDENSKEDMLLCFDKVLDKDGYIVEKNDPSVKILDQQGKPIHRSEFGGIMKGKDGGLVFIKNDIGSLMDLLDAVGFDEDA